MERRSMAMRTPFADRKVSYLRRAVRTLEGCRCPRSRPRFATGSRVPSQSRRRRRRRPGRRSPPGEHALISAPTGSGKTLAAFLWALDRLVAEPTGRGQAHAARLRLAAEGALLRHREEPARAAARDRRGHHRRHPHRRHAAEGAARHGPPPARHPHHDARVAVPDAHEPGARDLPRHRVGDRRRDPRRRPDQARRAPRAHARAARRAGRARRPADRAVRDAEPARGGRPLPRRPEAHLHGHRHRRAQAARPQDPRAGRVDGRARPGHERRRPRPLRGRRGDPQVDLARDLPRDPAAGARPPLDDRVRQQPPRGRAARAAAQRAGRGAAAAAGRRSRARTTARSRARSG